MLEQPKLHQFDRVLYLWFTTVCSERKPMTGPVIIEKVKSLYDEMRIIDKCHTLRAGFIMLVLSDNLECFII